MILVIFIEHHKIKLESIQCPTEWKIMFFAIACIHIQFRHRLKREKTKLQFQTYVEGKTQMHRYIVTSSPLNKMS